VLDEEALAASPGDPDAQWSVTVTLSNLGGVLTRLRRRDDSLVPWMRAIEMRRAIVAADPRDRRAVEGLAIMLGWLATRAYEDKRFADSVAYNPERARLLDLGVSPGGTTPRARSDHALARLELVMALVAQADADADARGALMGDARDLLQSSPAEAFTTPSAFSGVGVETFRKMRSSLARRLGVADSTGPR